MTSPIPPTLVRFRFITVGLLVLGALWFGCKSSEISSQWRTNEIIIDGNDSDWRGIRLIEAGKARIGLQNDDRFLYVLLKTNDRKQVEQIMRQGLTLWFDQFGGKDKIFGIRFPIGPRMDKFRRGQKPSRDEMKNDHDRMRDELLSEIEIIPAGEKNPQRMSVIVAQTNGIEVKVRPSEDVIVYELKVPLLEGTDSPFAVGSGWVKVHTDRAIGIGFESGRSKPPGMDRGGSMGGPPMGGGGGGRGGKGGQPGMGMPPGGARMGGHSEEWTKFRLAEVTEVKTDKVIKSSSEEANN